MIDCPSCRCPNDARAGTCCSCGADLSTPPERPASPRDLEEALRRRFVCPKGCATGEAAATRIATTGTGLSRLFDIQQYRFAAISCARCGLTEFYSLDILEGEDRGGSILDALLGG